jgi:hypothetical protein
LFVRTCSAALLYTKATAFSNFPASNSFITSTSSGTAAYLSFPSSA